MRGKYIVPTRTCRVCSLLRFDGKKWCFSRLSDQFKPLPFPDRSFFQLVQTVCVHTMTGPSHAACNIGRDLHFRLDRYRDAALLYCITGVKIFHSTVATAAQLAVHKDSSGFEGNLIRQRYSWRFCLETFSCRLTMEPLRGDSVSSATRTTGERSLQPQIHLLHLPQRLSRLEARKTDNDNAKQQKRKIENNSNCLQPLACAQASHSVFKQAGERPAFRDPLTRMEPSLSSTKQAPFFHCTIAWLAAAHTFLMAEISRHALTDLSMRQPWDPEYPNGD